MKKLFLWIFLLLAGCQLRPPPRALDLLSRETRQAIVVTSGNPARPPVAIRLYERDAPGWRQIGSSIAGVAGRNGVAPPGIKHEGDGRTPTGVYALERGFGYEPLQTKLPYIVLTPDMTWIDDPASPRYNMLSTRAQAAGVSHEIMRRDDDLYRYGFVIEYNTRRIIAGAGSAIFFHVWPGPGRSTAGCVATDQAHVVRILRWLDPAKRPAIVIRESSQND